MVQSLVVLLIVLVGQHLPPADPLKVIPDLRNDGYLRGLRPFGSGSVLSSQVVEVFIAMALAGLAGMAIGLFVSAAVRKSDQAVFMLPVILIVQMALSQPILQLSNPSPVLKVLGDVTSANWGVNALASTTSLDQLMTSYSVANNLGLDQLKFELSGGRLQTPPAAQQAQLHSAVFGDPAWAHKSGTWVLAIFILVLMIAIILGGVLLMMRRLDTGSRRTLLEDVQGIVGSAAAKRQVPGAGGPGQPGAGYPQGYPPAQPGAPYPPGYQQPPPGYQPAQPGYQPAQPGAPYQPAPAPPGYQQAPPGYQ
jgi:hypothetical protein